MRGKTGRENDGTKQTLTGAGAQYV
jgi:hypothetical protein